MKEDFMTSLLRHYDVGTPTHVQNVIKNTWLHEPTLIIWQGGLIKEKNYKGLTQMTSYYLQHLVDLANYYQENIFLGSNSLTAI